VFLMALVTIGLILGGTSVLFLADYGS